MTSMAASAAVVVYSDQSKFDLAVAGGTPLRSFDFSGVTATYSLSRAGVEITSFGNTMETRSNSFGTFLYSIVDDPYVVGQNKYQVWSFADDTYAIGFDFRGAGAENLTHESVRITIGFGGQNAVAELAFVGGEHARSGFAGFVSSTPFTKIMFDGDGGTGEDDYYIGNVETHGDLGQPDPTPGAQVPLPAGLPLLAGGLLAFGLLGRRRKG